MRRFIGAATATSLALATGLLTGAPALALATTDAPVASSISSSVPARPSLSRATATKLGRWLKQYKGYAFNSVVSIGDPALYLSALGRSTVKVDKNLSSVARYDPDTSTVWLSQDPRDDLSSADSAILSESVWHELTHALEFANGDSSVALDPKAWAEHRIDYMTYMAKTTLPTLELLERKAKEGASVERLRAIWKKFLEFHQAANSQATTSIYPADPNELRAWFGVDVDPETVKAFYLSGQFLPGKAGENLREALDPTPEESSSSPIAGTWKVGLGTVKVTAQGSGFVGTVTKTITGFVCTHPVGEEIWRMSGDGTTYTGSARLNITGGNSCTSDMDPATFVLLSPDMLQVNYVADGGAAWTLYLAYR